MRRTFEITSDVCLYINSENTKALLKGTINQKSASPLTIIGHVIQKTKLNNSNPNCIQRAQKKNLNLHKTPFSFSI